MKIKEQLYNDIISFVNERYLVVKNLTSSIQESLQSETKSSAGDKHETGRAMLQLEREKAANQFVEIQRLKNILIRIKITKISEKICLGSLVHTNKGVYFIAIGKGVVVINKKQYFVIALNSPIGKLLFGKQKGEEFVFKKVAFKILNVL